MTDPVSLHDQLDQLRHILAAARSTAFWRHVPILDDSSEGDVLDVHENDLSGLKHFKQSIQKEIEVIESVSGRLSRIVPHRETRAAASCL